MFHLTRLVRWLIVPIVATQCSLLTAQSARRSLEPTATPAVKAANISTPAGDSNARQAAEFLKELDSLGPDDIAAKADSLSGELLMQLRFGPSMEQTKQRRAAWQRLRVQLAKDQEKDEALLNQLRTRLTSQLDQVQQQSQGDSALISARSRAIVEASSESIRTLQHRIDRLRGQVASLDNRIRTAVNYEQTTLDSMDFARSSTRDSNAFELPDDPGLSAEIVTVVSKGKRNPDASTSLADLLKQLGIKVPASIATATTSNRKER